MLSAENYAHCSWLPPANEVWGKVIFSVTCVKNSVHSGEVCLSACWDTNPLSRHPQTKHLQSTPPGTRHPLPGADTPTPWTWHPQPGTPRPGTPPDWASPWTRHQGDASVHAGIPPPRADIPQTRHLPLSRLNWDHAPPRADTPRTRQPPPRPGTPPDQARHPPPLPSAYWEIR